MLQGAIITGFIIYVGARVCKWYNEKEYKKDLDYREEWWEIKEKLKYNIKLRIYIFPEEFLYYSPIRRALQDISEKYNGCITFNHQASTSGSDFYILKINDGEELLKHLEEIKIEEYM